MKILLINIIVLFLIFQSAICRNVYSQFKSNEEIFEIAYPLDPDNSGILGSIILDVSYVGTPPNQNEGIAQLEWNFIDGSTDNYIISRSIEGANWLIIDEDVPGHTPYI